MKEKKRLEELKVDISWAEVGAIIAARKDLPPRYNEAIPLDRSDLE